MKTKIGVILRDPTRQIGRKIKQALANKITVIMKTTPKLIQSEVVEMLNDLLIASDEARNKIRDCTNETEWRTFTNKRTNLLIDCAEKVQEFYDKREASLKAERDCHPQTEKMPAEQSQPFEPEAKV